ncbi:phospho-2-dehydro-3-deoxyheptonate aldolase [Alishewanella longhuensis]
MSMIVDDLRIVAQKPLSSPAVLKKVLPLSEQGSEFVGESALRHCEYHSWY